MTTAPNTPCRTSNAHPGVKVGTPVVLLDPAEHVYGETVRVRLQDGRETVMHAQSLVPMLAEEVEDWQVNR